MAGGQSKINKSNSHPPNPIHKKKAMGILKIAKSSARTLEEKKKPAQTPKQVTNRQP